MRIYEITKPKQQVLARAVLKPKRLIKGPYAPPPKALPKPKPLTPTPLEIKRNQEKIQQSYTNSLINNLGKNSASPSRATNQSRSPQEMETFIKIVRGEIPEKPQ